MGVLSGLIANPLVEAPTVHVNWTEPDIALFTAHVRNKLLAGAPSHLKVALLTMLSAIDAKKKVHEAAALLGQLGDMERVRDRFKQRIVEEIKPTGRQQICKKTDLLQWCTNIRQWKQPRQKGKLKSSPPKGREQKS